MGVTTAAQPSLPENCPKLPLDIGYNSAILVPMTTTTQKKTYPTLAEIVREETDGGRLIVRFYLGVASGALDGFEACHRAAAARQVHRLAPHLVEEYLAKYAGAPCDHGKKAKNGRKGRRRARPSPAKLYPDRVKLEDLHDCPVHMAPGASVFQRRLALAIQKETGNGAEIIDFMIDVMCGDIPGFKACHRIEAAKEMAGYIIRDEERSTARIPWPADPFESARPPNRNRPPTKAKPEAEDTAVPATEPNGTVATADTEIAVPAPSSVVPAKAGTHPNPAEAPIKATKPEPTSDGLNKGPQEVARPEPLEEQLVRPKPLEEQLVRPKPLEEQLARPEPVEGQLVRPEPVEGQFSAPQPTIPANPELAPKLALFLERAKDDPEHRLHMWHDAYDALRDRSKTEDVTDLFEWITGQVLGPDRRYVWDSEGIPIEIITQPELDYAAMDPAELIDPNTGYVPILSHPHPSTPWMKKCDYECDIPEHHHEPPPKIDPVPTIAERRIQERLRDYRSGPDPFVGTPFFPGRSPPG